MAPCPIVIDNAVTRLLERVHGLGHLADSCATDRDRDRAAAGAALLGLTVDEARDLVCPPRLHAALAMGFDAIVKGNDRTLRVVEGRVVTCVAPQRTTRRQQPREVAA